eukprot:256517-Chlamydomonas_euryale.AAC.5
MTCRGSAYTTHANSSKANTSCLWAQPRADLNARPSHTCHAVYPCSRLCQPPPLQLRSRAAWDSKHFGRCHRVRPGERRSKGRVGRVADAVERRPRCGRSAVQLRTVRGRVCDGGGEGQVSQA